MDCLKKYYQRDEKKDDTNLRNNLKSEIGTSLGLPSDILNLVDTYIDTTKQCECCSAVIDYKYRYNDDQDYYAEHPRKSTPKRDWSEFGLYAIYQQDLKYKELCYDLDCDDEVIVCARCESEIEPVQKYIKSIEMKALESGSVTEEYVIRRMELFGGFEPYLFFLFNPEIASYYKDKVHDNFFFSDMREFTATHKAIYKLYVEFEEIENDPMWLSTEDVKEKTVKIDKLMKEMLDISENSCLLIDECRIAAGRLIEDYVEKMEYHKERINKYDTQSDRYSYQVDEEYIGDKYEIEENEVWLNKLKC